ncbi:SAV_2336 N-terminal domain-related protein [Streptomyces sp. KR80]|uniref:SAV_2336 N-terminal domain-related protein n=1 Tax=Streptomyces sp. KR80 TaxID=3457426 RepID=UPI003FD65690
MTRPAADDDRGGGGEQERTGSSRRAAQPPAHARLGRLDAALSVLAGSGVELSQEELLDVLWLASRLPAGTAAAPLQGALTGTVPPGSVVNAPLTGEPGRAGTAAPDGIAGAGRTSALPGSPDPLRARRDERSDLYASSGSARSQGLPGADGAVPLRAPEAKALQAELPIGRALRPLKQYRQSPVRQEFDEGATAAALAETGLPDVVTRPARERWLDLAFVVDDGMSMLLWRRLATELRTLLERAGAFRVVRVHGLHARGADAPRLRSRPYDPDASTLPVSALADPTGRTLVLVMSDGMGASWHDGRMAAVLERWAGCGPTAVVHALPSRLWDGSGIRATRRQVTTRRRGSANTDWTVTDPVLPVELAPFDGTPVPVLEPDVAALGGWARLISSPGGTGVLPLLARSHPRRTTGAAAPVDGLRLVQHFRDAASPEAYRLAAHLAAVAPVSVPVMRLVQEVVPWRADTGHLAEVFLGGLMRPAVAEGPESVLPQHRAFAFTDAAQSALLDAVPVAELLDTGQAVGRRLEQLAGRSPDFPAWLAQPNGPDSLPPGARPFTAVERRLAARLGAPRRPARPPAESADDRPPMTGERPSLGPGWERLSTPLTIGPFTLHACNATGARALAYLGRDQHGTEAVVRTARPLSTRAQHRLLSVAVEAMRRMSGRYAPALLGHHTLDDSTPWLAEEFIRAADGSPAPKLSHFLKPSRRLSAHESIRLAWQVSDAVSVCHRVGMALEDLHAGTVLVASGGVVLTGWTSAVIEAWEPSPHHYTRLMQDNVSLLGSILAQLGGGVPMTALGKVDYSPSFPSLLPRWQGPQYTPARRIVLRCLSDSVEDLPTAQEVADVFAQFLPRAVQTSPPAVERSRPGGPRRPEYVFGDTLMSGIPHVGPSGPPFSVSPTPSSAAASAGGSTGGLLARISSLFKRGGRASEAEQERSEAELERLLQQIRTPLQSCHRIAVIGSGRRVGATTTMAALGTILAAERRDRVIAVDTSGRGSRTRAKRSVDGSWESNHRVGREPQATFGDLIRSLPDVQSYLDVRLLTSQAPSGLDTLARDPDAPVTPGDYRRAMDMLSRYYSIILSDIVLTSHPDGTQDSVSPGDQLIVVVDRSEISETTVGGTLAAFDWLVDSGHGAHLRHAIAVVSDARGNGPPTKANPMAPLRDSFRGVVTVPYDEHLAADTELDLQQLHPDTRAAYYELAALVAEGFPEPPPVIGRKR